MVSMNTSCGSVPLTPKVKHKINEREGKENLTQSVGNRTCAVKGCKRVAARQTKVCEVHVHAAGVCQCLKCVGKGIRKSDLVSRKPVSLAPFPWGASA